MKHLFQIDVTLQPPLSCVSRKTRSHFPSRGDEWMMMGCAEIMARAFERNKTSKKSARTQTLVIRLKARRGRGERPPDATRSRETLRASSLQRDVAIKILPREFAADPDRLVRFNREARVLARSPKHARRPEVEVRPVRRLLI